jgi:pilus assembly protein CpaF
MALMSDVDLPAAHIRNQVAGALDVIVQLARFRGGRRVVSEVSVVEGTKHGEPLVSPVFRFRARSGAEGGFEAVGSVPDLAGTLVERGEDTRPDLFVAGSDQ